jgi:hypothetical protein
MDAKQVSKLVSIAKQARDTLAAAGPDPDGFWFAHVEALVASQVADDAAVAALLGAPWGPHGAWFITRQANGICGPLHVTLWQNREPVAMVKEISGRLVLPGDWGWYHETRAEAKARRQGAAAAYHRAMADAAALCSAGVLLPCYDGQHGGYFVLPDGARVSAPGLVRRLGLPEAAWYDGPWREAVHQYAQACAAVAPEQATAPTARERAAARWARNVTKPVAKPQGKGKPWVRETPLRVALAY